MAGTSKLDFKLYITGCLLLFLCSVSSLEIGGREVTLGLSRVNWHTAYTYCVIQGKQLMVIKTVEENRRVLELAKRHDSFWLGATYEGFNRWTWLPTGETVRQTWWQNGEPSHEGTENCVEMNDEGGWNDVRCWKLRYYLCQETDLAIAKKELNEMSQLAKNCGTELMRLENVTRNVI